LTGKLIFRGGIEMVKHETEKFFNMPAGGYCGLLLRESTMKKMQKLLYKQTQEIKKLLKDSLDDIEVSDWTLVYPNDVQTAVYYFDASSTVAEKIERIDSFDKATKLQLVKEVFSSDKMYSDSKSEIEEFARKILSN